MKKIAFVALLFFLLSPTAFAQEIAKTLAFAQVVGGGTGSSIWETIVNLANAGTTTYTGTFTLYTMSNGTPQPWNPTVNGNATAFTNGQMVISINAGDTVTLTITGGSTTLTGYGTIAPTGSSSTDETSFLAGTLTYYVMNGPEIADVTNSIGIQPSDPLYMTTIPFDTFDNIGLALANNNETADSLTLNLYPASGGSPTTSQLVLQPNEHVAEYLWQIFSNVQMAGGGRLDIFSDATFYGIAVTDVNNQFSSLPLLPGVVAYTWVLNGTGANGGALTETGDVSFRFYGTQGEYQGTILTRNGNPVANPTLHYAVGAFNRPTYSAYIVETADNQLRYWSLNVPSFSDTTITGTVEAWTLNGTTVTFYGSGTITLTAPPGSNY